MHRRLGAVLLAAAWLAPRYAFACPECPTARVEQGFWTHLYLIALPLLVLGVIRALLYPIGVERRRREDEGRAC